MKTSLQDRLVKAKKLLVNKNQDHNSYSGSSYYQIQVNMGRMSIWNKLSVPIIAEYEPIHQQHFINLVVLSNLTIGQLKHHLKTKLALDPQETFQLFCDAKIISDQNLTIDKLKKSPQGIIRVTCVRLESF